MLVVVRGTAWLSIRYMAYSFLGTALLPFIFQVPCSFLTAYDHPPDVGFSEYISTVLTWAVPPGAILALLLFPPVRTRLPDVDRHY